MPSTSISLDSRSINRLVSGFTKAIGSSTKSNSFPGMSDTSKTGGIDTAAILNSITEAAQAKIDKKQVKTELLKEQSEALNDLKSVASSMHSAVQDFKSTTSSSGIFNSFTTSGVPSGVTVAPSRAASVGTHTMAVSSVASKQIIEIRSKDDAGNPVPFTTGAVVVSTNGAGGLFSDDATVGLFHIYSDSNNNTLLGEVSIAGGEKLEDIADLINNNVGVAAVLKATVQPDGDGEKLVLESINAGAAGDFYISYKDIANATVDNGLDPYASAIFTLSVSTPNDRVQSIDIYSKLGNSFASPTGTFTADDDHNLSFQAGTWNIGTGQVVLSSVSSLKELVTNINAFQHSTGVTAKIVEVEDGGFIIRATSVSGQLNYSPESFSTIFMITGDGPATATQVRPTAAVNTVVKLDGATYDIGDELTLESPIADISSITVSAPTPLTTITINHDTANLTDAVTTLVDTINDTLQFIAQQQDEDAPLEGKNIVNSLRKMINDLVSNSTDTMSLSRMGITWMDFTPTQAEKRDGMVPARYLSINSTTLNTMLTTNFDEVKGFFTGALSNATTATSTATLSVASNVINISQFDLAVRCTDPVGPPPTFTATVSNYGGGADLTLDVLWLGGTKLLLKGQAGTILEGLSINYEYTGVGGFTALNTNPTRGDSPAIKFYNSASLKLTTSLKSYLDVYGSLEKAITHKRDAIKNSINDIQKITDKRDEQLSKAQVRIRKLLMDIMMLESIKKTLEARNKG